MYLVLKMLFNFDWQQVNNQVSQESNEESLLKDDSLTNKSTKGSILVTIINFSECRKLNVNGQKCPQLAWSVV